MVIYCVRNCLCILSGFRPWQAIGLANSTTTPTPTSTPSPHCFRPSNVSGAKCRDTAGACHRLNASPAHAVATLPCAIICTLVLGLGLGLRRTSGVCPKESCFDDLHAKRYQLHWKPTNERQPRSASLSPRIIQTDQLTMTNLGSLLLTGEVPTDDHCLVKTVRLAGFCFWIDHWRCLAVAFV